MSTVPADPQISTVPRLRRTPDGATLAVTGPAVMSLADIAGRPANVTFCAPSGLGSCEDCVEVHSIAVATITWPDPHERTGHGEITVCRDCLGHQITARAAEVDLDVTIDVEVPAWTESDLVAQVDGTGLVLVFLTAEDGGRYLADEVDHARRVVSLRRLGMTLTMANALLRKHPDLARSVEAALQEMWGAA